MRVSNKLEGYSLIDASQGERLERWGNLYLVRPDPQVVWKTPKRNRFWEEPDARYVRSKSGGGSWECLKSENLTQITRYEDIKFLVKPMNFKHMGIFPEQAANWELITKEIKAAKPKLKTLCLFGYTGAASLVAAQAGAEVCHVDAARGMVNWGKENAQLSNIAHLPIRWIVDDCVKFVKREVKRGHKYDAIILDPPSYGRGPCGEIWRLEEDLFEFLNLITALLSEDFSFVLLNLYSGGLSAGVANCLMELTLGRRFKLALESDEIGINVKSSKITLPCGITCVARRK